MNKEEKKMFLEVLKSNDLYKFALDRAENDEQRRKISAFAEDIFLQLAENSIPLKKVMEENPEKVAEAAKNFISKINK
jgi:hypothetical protein